jgi:hypothetical protein
LRQPSERSKISARMPGDVRLICDECGCASDQYGTGWAAFHGEVPDEIESHRPSLPAVGETILRRKVAGGEQTYGYVTRVNPSADTPIAVTAVASEASTEPDYLVA